MSETISTPRIVVVGAGAAGSLTVLHVARTARRRGTPLEVVLLDPAAYRARGTAFGTTDERHLLNVPAGGMSALPEEPGHFVAWRARNHPELLPEPGVFAPRAEWARYLDETLDCAYSGDVPLGLRHLRVRAAGVRRDGSGVLVTSDDAQVHRADAVVLATGERAPGCGWAPAGLRDSAFFVPDPWAPGALDVVRRDGAGPADVLLVGTGLTMVDVVLSLTGPARRPERRIHAVSRHGKLPARHGAELQLAAIPEIDDWGHTLEDYRCRTAEHLARVERATGDWRPAMDGLRTVVQALWQRLDESEREEFLRVDASDWGRLRHRMPPESADVVEALERAALLTRARPRSSTLSRSPAVACGSPSATAPCARSAGLSTAPAPAPPSLPASTRCSTTS